MEVFVGLGDGGRKLFFDDRRPGSCGTLTEPGNSPMYDSVYHNRKQVYNVAVSGPLVKVWERNGTIVKQPIAGDMHLFTISYAFFDESHETEIALPVDGDNILAFERDGKILTTRWNFDELAFWLRDFLNRMTEDPYPADAAGRYAAEKDLSAREFDSDDEAEFDAYYDLLDDWNLRHRWHPASGGAILADLYFQQAGENVEISWNNQEPEKGVCFKYKLGGVCIPKEQFCSAVDSFLKAYAVHWF